MEYIAVPSRNVNMERILYINGEMPFTEALSSALTPAYDDGKTIYEGCIALLDEALEEFDRKTRINENVLRHLVIRLDEE